jgi:hypothetical protein
MTAGWTPKPGSVADRAITYLQSQQAGGAEVSSAALAEAIGAPLGSIVPCLQPALDAGLVHARQKGGHARSPKFWSLVSKIENRAWVPKPAGAHDDDGKPIQRIVPAKGAPPLPIVPPLFPSATSSTDMSCSADNEPPLTAVEQRVPESWTAGQRLPAREAPAEQANPARGVQLEPRVMRTALWSAGSLEIRRGTASRTVDLLILTADETRALVRYLERMADSGDGAA